MALQYFVIFQEISAYKEIVFVVNKCSMNRQNTEHIKSHIALWRYVLKRVKRKFFCDTSCSLRINTLPYFKHVKIWAKSYK